MDTFQMVVNEINKTLHLWAESFAANLPNLLVAFVIIVVFYVFSIFIAKWTTKLLDRTHFHASLKVLLGSVMRILVVTFGIFFALGVVGLDKTVVSLMAGVGVIGLALGFAFKDLASNLISGLFIAIQNPFDIGDKIKINNITGTVDMIRLRDTILNAGNGQKIYIPNKSFMEDPLVNFSQTAEKRFELTVGVSYDDDLEAVIENLKKDLSAVADQKKGKAVSVQVKEFTPAAVMLEIQLWIDIPGIDDMTFTNRAMIAIKSSLQKNGFHIPVSSQALSQNAVH